jgi:hypothetical protein
MRRTWLPRFGLHPARLALLVTAIGVVTVSAVSAKDIANRQSNQSLPNLKHSELTVVTGPASTPPLSPGGAKTESIATCPTGTHVLGGGYKVVGGPFAADGIVVVTNGPLATGNGWDFVAVQFPSTFGQSGYQFQAQAICAIVVP